MILILVNLEANKAQKLISQGTLKIDIGLNNLTNQMKRYERKYVIL